MEKRIAVIITARNEEENIRDCIESAKLLTTDIILFDIASTDNTAPIAKKLGVAVETLDFTPFVEPVRGISIEKTDAEWVLILDADEKITKELANEIKSSIKTKEFTQFKIPRKNIFGKKWLEHGGWWPDYQIRLINKKSFISWPKEIHSTPNIEGKLGTLKNPLLHLFHGNFEQMVNKTIVFEDIESELLYKAHKKVHTFTFFRKFLGELYRRLIKNLGFFDGSIGIIEGIYQAFSKTITWLFLYEKKKSRSL